MEYIEMDIRKVYQSNFLNEEVEEKLSNLQAGGVKTWLM